MLPRDALLPLTCTRLGTCCHGKVVWVTPWEAGRLAVALALSPADFRARHTVDGGIRLAMDGARGHRNQPACTLYRDSAGCAVHGARPLACRLFPLGRQRQGETVGYVHETPFPCLDGCPGVRELPQLSVADYLAEQDVAAGEQAQDLTIELAQDLGEAAFVLTLDHGLDAQSQQAVLARWQTLARQDVASRSASLSVAWRDLLTIPDLQWTAAPDAFISAHRAVLDPLAQAAMTARGPAAIIAATDLVAAALHLAQSAGADSSALAEHWCRALLQHR